MRSLRETSSVIGGPMGARSIRVLQIALFALQCHHRLLGSFRGQPFYVGIGADQRGANVLRHRLGVTAYVEIGSAFQPFDQIGTTFPELVLDVDLLRGVA